MTQKNGLFVTQAELAARMGITKELLGGALLALDKSGFPPPDPLFENRRYWPACEAFLDRRYGLAASSQQGNPGLDGVEKWD